MALRRRSKREEKRTIEDVVSDARLVALELLTDTEDAAWGEKLDEDMLSEHLEKLGALHDELEALE